MDSKRLCRLTLALRAMHGDRHTGDYVMYLPKKKKYTPDEFFSTSMFIETAVRTGLFRCIYLSYCHGQLAVNNISPETGDPHVNTTCKVIAYLAQGLPLLKGGQFALKDDTYVTNVYMDGDTLRRTSLQGRIRPRWRGPSRWGGSGKV